MKNGMDRMEGDKALNNSSRRDYTTQNEEKAKWGRTAESQRKNQTKQKAACGYNTVLYTKVYLAYVFGYNCV